MSFHVLDAGPSSRIVDFGRPASRSLGVPVGGAADRAALALGNALVGNPPDAPALEISLKGPVLLAEMNWTITPTLSPGVLARLEAYSEVFRGHFPQSLGVVVEHRNFPLAIVHKRKRFRVSERFTQIKIQTLAQN